MHPKKALGKGGQVLIRAPLRREGGALGFRCTEVFIIANKEEDSRKLLKLI